MLLAAMSGNSDQPPRMNQLHGIVVFKEDGRPATGVPVVMAHSEKGYVRFADSGLSGWGGDERVLSYFIKRNSKHSCTAITDDAGRFTLANFAAPDQPWNLAAGNAERGYAVHTRLRPQDYTEGPLKIEIDKPAYLTTTLPPVPEPLRAYLAVTLAPESVTEAADTLEDEAADAAERVYFDVPQDETRQKLVRIGPLPGGQRYRVMAYASGRRLPYSATIFTRVVTPAPGATENVSLESAEGVTLAGRITSTEDKPLAQVNVMVKTADALVIGALTDNDGKYELRGIPAGTHKLKLLRHGKRMTPG